MDLVHRIARQRATGEPLRAPSPLIRGFLWTLGAVAALGFAAAMFSLRGVVASVLAALFFSIAVDPAIRALQRRGLSRPIATAVCVIVIVAVAVSATAFALPALQREAIRLVASVPDGVDSVLAAGWFDAINAATNGGASDAIRAFAEFASDPQTWLIVSGGVLGFGATVLNGVSSGFFILELTVYFVASFETMKTFAYSFVVASRRQRFTEIADRILASIGRYLGGMVVLALLNATFSTVLLVLVGVDGALLIGVAAFFITIIPLIGTILTTIGITLITLVQSPTSALVVLAFMLVYMQVEAYVLTPKVMKKAAQIPGSVVLISALAGGTLLGLPGALIGVPVAASIALVLNEVVLPNRAQR